MKLRRGNPADLTAINDPIVLLRDARDRLAGVGATKVAAAVRRALKSAEGARRHAERTVPCSLGGIGREFDDPRRS